MDFIDFTGEETEKEFLEKCYKQWNIVIEQSCSDVQKLMHLGGVFSEIRHRMEELGGD